MADKSMHQYSMEDDGNGIAGGPFVVTVGADGKLMQVREPLFMPASSGVPHLASGKREEMNSNLNANSNKNDVYQYVVNAAGGSGQYMGLMTMGPDGKLTSMRTDRNPIPQQPSSTAVIDFNGGKDPKAVLLQIHPGQSQLSHHSNQETHSQVQQQKHLQQELQSRAERSSIAHQPAAVIDFNNGKDPKTVLLQIHPTQPQLSHQSAQEAQNSHHSQVAQQQQHHHHQVQQLHASQSPQHQAQSHEQRQPLQHQQRRQSHQQVLRADKIEKGDREVVCAKSCRACCKFDEEDAPDVNAYVQQSMKEDSTTATPTSWTSEDSSSFPPSIGATSPNGPSKAARFQCKVCLKMFTQKVNLTAHERIHLGERPYQCKTCLKSFTQQSNLVTHERIHTGERPYQCNVCMKRFTQRQNLTAHERIHLGERPFTCQICNKSFTQSQNLTAHERIHLGERPFQCKVCLKTFTQQQNLNSHERIHHMERQFSCNICLRSFSQESSLQRHMQAHTGERPFTCQVCHRSFAQQSSLLVHEWVHKSPDRRNKRNVNFASVEQSMLDIPSSDQDHQQGEESLQEQKHAVQQREMDDEKCQVQCLT